MERVDLEAARAAVAEISKAIDSLGFCPPEGEPVHVKRAVGAMNDLARALKLPPPRTDHIPTAEPEPAGVVRPAAMDAINQAKVDAGINKMFEKYYGHELTPVLRTRIEREAREYLAECRKRKLISFIEVDVRVDGRGNINVEYHK